MRVHSTVRCSCHVLAPFFALFQANRCFLDFQYPWDYWNLKGDIFSTEDAIIDLFFGQKMAKWLLLATHPTSVIIRMSSPSPQLLGPVWWRLLLTLVLVDFTILFVGIRCAHPISRISSTDYYKYLIAGQYTAQDIYSNIESKYVSPKSSLPPSA
jgi:hypothetical protein